MGPGLRRPFEGCHVIQAVRAIGIGLRATYDRSMSRLLHRADPDVLRITNAPVSHEREIWLRQRRYMISMGIRTACFVAAVLVGSGWLRWVLIGGALVLPYVAVVMANSAAPQIPDTDPDSPHRDARALEPGDPGASRG